MSSVADVEVRGALPGRCRAPGRGPAFAGAGTGRSAGNRVTPRSCPSPGRGAAQVGFTLLEVAVALALAATVALVLVRFLGAARTAQTSGARASDAVLTLDLAADLLGGEVRRAGYGPVAPDALVEALSAATLRVVVHTERASGDALSVAYLDDRLAGGVVSRALRFEAGTDGRGAPQLYRITASGAKQPLVQGVTRLTVAGWADAVGLHGRASLTPGAFDPWLLLLRVESAPAAPARVFAVPLPSRPSATVEVGP